MRRSQQKGQKFAMRERIGSDYASVSSAWAIMPHKLTKNKNLKYTSTKIKRTGQ
jgi:hypothetical protein